MLGVAEVLRDEEERVDGIADFRSHEPLDRARERRRERPAEHRRRIDHQTTKERVGSEKPSLAHGGYAEARVVRRIDVDVEQVDQGLDPPKTHGRVRVPFSVRQGRRFPLDEELRETTVELLDGWRRVALFGRSTVKGEQVR